jgi:MoaA/NifB/PqqE/SkfB family radical SAM enzyme
LTSAAGIPALGFIRDRAMPFTADDFASDSIVWHFELTSRCTLACPSCSRTVPRVAYQVRDLEPDKIKTYFTAGVLAKTKKVIYSGNLGDPIYHRELPEIVRFFTAAGVNQTVVTNGSWRNARWWETLVAALDRNDVVIFSIDGLRDTNPTYRINSNWDSIMAAVGTCRGRVRMHWKFIAFSHNEHQIEEARALSRELGFEKFLVVVSWRSKYEGMAPRKTSLEKVASAQDLKVLDPAREAVTLSPKCLRGDHWFISHDGQFYPCCMMAAVKRHLEPTVFFREREAFDVARHGLGAMLASAPFGEFIDTLNDPARTYAVCREKCGTVGHTNRAVVLDP